MSDAEMLEASESTAAVVATEDQETEDNMDFEAAVQPADVEAKIIKAFSFKERGNEAIRVGDYPTARRHYERGIQLADSLPGNDQAEGLSLTLHLNLSLAAAKLEDHPAAARAAEVVLKVEPTNVKGLFRRGMARSSLGQLEDAKTDFVAVLKASPKDGAARKELANVKKRMDAAREAEKAAFGNLFKRKASLYNDRQAEADAQREADETKWRQDNEERVSMGIGQTFEEWKASKRSSDASMPPLMDLPPPLNGAAGSQAAPAAEAAAPVGGSSGTNGLAEAGVAQPPRKAATTQAEDDDDGLDEEDRKIINETKKQGYCYFRRQLPEEEAKLLEQEQQRLRASASSSSSALQAPQALSPAAAATAGNKQVSAAEWNAGGTWEEVDKTAWAQQRLRALLSGVTVSDGVDVNADPAALLRELGDFDFAGGLGGQQANGGGLEQLAAFGVKLAQLSAKVTVRKLEGNAHVSMARGRKRYLFDFNGELDVEVTADRSLGMAPPSPPSEQAQAAGERQKEVFKAQLTLPELSHEDVDRGGFETEPQFSSAESGGWPAAWNGRMVKLGALLKAEVLSSLQAFSAEYRAL